MSLGLQIPDAPEAVAASATASPSVPPLEHGDHLTRSEFERRYEAMPEIKKAELIEGVVHMSSPVRFRSHSKPHTRIIHWLSSYEDSTPAVETGDNATIRLGADNDPQPDALLMIDGGQARISNDDYVEGAPELIVEIAASSVEYDLRGKKETYRLNGVQEYIVWSIYDRKLDWFCLEAGDYVPLHPDSDGIIRSRVFPGLWLDAEALLKDDRATVLTVLQQGLASEEHMAFVQQLAERSRPK